MKKGAVVTKEFYFLLATLLIKVALYFTFFDSESYNQAIKLVGRVSIDVILLFYVITKCRTSLSLIGLYLRNTSPIILYILFLILAFVSTLWSSNPLLSLKQFFMVLESLVFSILFVFIIFHVRKNQIWLVDIGSLLIVATTIITFVFLVGSLLNPDVFYRGMRGGTELRLGGYMMNPNELGMLANIAIGLGITRLFRGISLLVILAITINLFVLFETGSRSSVIALGLMTLFLVLYLGKLKHILFYVGAVIVPVLILIEKVVFKTGAEEVLSMTGRIPFWGALLTESFSVRPILGHGFMRISDSDVFAGFQTYGGGMAHNTFLQVLLGLGIIGFVIAILQFISTLRNVFHKLAGDIFLVSIIVPIVLNSMTEFGIYGMSNYGVLFWQLVVVYIVVDWSRIDSKIEFGVPGIPDTRSNNR
jgi:O-antigen ligase